MEKKKAFQKHESSDLDMDKKKRVFEWSENAHCALSRRWKQALRLKLALQQDNSVHITNETVENCANSICISRQFEYAGDPSQMRRRPNEQIAEHYQLQTATKSQVGRRNNLQVLKHQWAMPQRGSTVMLSGQKIIKVLFQPGLISTSLKSG